MRLRGRSLLLFSLLALSGLGCRAEALSPQYERWFARELAFIVGKAERDLVPYRWGRSGSDLTKGLDCSGYMYRAARWAGMPVKRTTARRMAMGSGGWIGVIVARGDRKPTDLAFWTFDQKRPNGHVGAIFGDSNHVTHASPSRNKVLVDKLKGILVSKLSRLARLTLGD